MSSLVATAAPPDLEGQPNNTRFKVVKIDSQRSTAGKSHPKGAEDGHVHEHILMPNGQKSFTYKRGRWTVTDFYDPPAVPAPVSNPSSSSNSTPSTPTLTSTLSPLSRLVTAAPIDLHGMETFSSGQPTSPPAFEEIPALTLAPTPIQRAAPPEGKEAPVVPVIPTTQSSATLTDVSFESKDAEIEQLPALPLPLTSTHSADEGKKSQPNSCSITPTDSDLTSFATAIKAHPEVLLPASAGAKNEADVRMDATASAVKAAISAVIGREEAEKVGGDGAATNPAVEPASGYATPASIHSVTGGNAAILPPYVSSVAIDNKIEQAMDLVKSHLMFAVREEVDVLKEKIVGLLERIQALETENAILKQSHEMQQHMSQKNQHPQSLLTNMSMGSSHAGSPVNPDTAQELASLVAEVALASPVAAENVLSEASAPQHLNSPAESAVSPEDSKK